MFFASLPLQRNPGVLRHLDLQHNFGISSVGAVTLATCLGSVDPIARPVASSLHALHLGYTKLGDAGVAAVAEVLPRLPALTVLDLASTACGLAGAQALALAFQVRTDLNTRSYHIVAQSSLLGFLHVYYFFFVLAPSSAFVRDRFGSARE